MVRNPFGELPRRQHRIGAVRDKRASNALLKSTRAGLVTKWLQETNSDEHLHPRATNAAVVARASRLLPCHSEGVVEKLKLGHGVSRALMKMLALARYGA